MDTQYIGIIKKVVGVVNNYKRLFNNSILFAVGNLGSKFIAFFMLPLYTAQLRPKTYGVIDVITTTSALLLPVITLSVFDAVLRFSIGKNVDYPKLYSNSVSISRKGFLVALVACPILYVIDKPFAVLPILLILQAYQSLFAQLAKGLNRIPLFTANGILLAILTALLNVIFLWPLHLGFIGYFLSTILALIASDTFLFASMKLHHLYRSELIDRQYQRELLRFSVPLIPNSIAWNISNTAGRYAIMIFLGPAANGLFAVANKIPTILSTFTSIFSQSWEISAIESYENDGQQKQVFFERIYHLYILVLFLGSSVLMLFLKLIVKILVSPAYYSSWRYIPFLLVTVVFSSLSGFLGSEYVAQKRTKEVFRTTVIGSIISIATSFILTPFFGVNAVGFGSLLGFLVVWIIRHQDIRRLVHHRVRANHVLSQLTILLVQYLLLYVPIAWISVLLQCLIVITIVYINRKTVNVLVGLLKKHE